MLRQLIYIGFLFLYHILFWKEGIGVNWVLFSSASLLFLRKLEPLGKNEWLYLAPYIASISGLLFTHSVFSIVATLLTYVTYVGYVANRQTSVLENVFNSLLSFVTFRVWHPAIQRVTPIASRGFRFSRGMSIATIPVVIFIAFYALFVVGNPVFEEFHKATLVRFVNALGDINFVWTSFMFLGVFLVRWAILGSRKPFLALSESDFVQRKRLHYEGGMMELKIEYQMAVVLFASLNGLFAIANFIDVKWVWFQFYVADHFSLKEFVHHGVGYLIFITLISAAILLVFFRRNLNFYPNNKRLIQLASLWTIQNIILTISVIIRTAHYIGFHGLAPLRLGVLIFSAVLLVALFSVLMKIRQKHSLAWVTRRTSAFSLLLLGFCAVVPWNKWTAIQNLSHPMANEVDVDYYLELTPEAYPIVYENLDIIERQLIAHSSNPKRWIDHDYESFVKSLDRRTARFIERYEAYGWASWSPAAHSAYVKLVEISKNREEIESITTSP